MDILDGLDLASDGLADEDDARRLRSVEVPVLAEGAGQQGVTVPMDLQHRADDAAHGLYLVADLDTRTLRGAGGLRLALLRTEEEEIPQDPDGQDGEQVRTSWTRKRNSSRLLAAKTKWAIAMVAVIERSLNLEGCDAPP